MCSSGVIGIILFRDQGIRDERKLRAREFSFNLFPINKINRIRGERESSIRENF